MPTAESVTIQDYLAIMRAFNQYCRAIDDRQWDDLDHVFSKDALWIMATGLEVNGVEEIKSLMRQFSPDLPYRYLHTVSNIDLQFEGDTVTSTSNWTYLVRKSPENGPTEEMHVFDNAWYVGSVGTYDDRLEKIDGEWLFTYRRIFNWEFSEPPTGD